jgi:hypothetical protein
MTLGRVDQRTTPKPDFSLLISIAMDSNIQKSRIQNWSIATRLLASLNIALIFSCLVIGKHDLMVPHEKPIGLSIPYWAVPTTLLLLLATVYRFIRYRDPKQIGIDLLFVAASLIFLAAYIVSQAGL